MPTSTPPGILFADSTASEMSPAGKRVYVIDDDREVRRSLHFLLSTADIVSWPYRSASDFLESLENLLPAPILLDIRMPKIDGIQLMSVLRDRAIKWPVIILTAHGEIQIAVQAMKLGAIEFLEKPFEFDALETCLQTAFTRLASATNIDAIQSSARCRFDLLSPREHDVATLLMQGMSNKVAAHRLSLSVRTIEMHRANALAKLNVKSLAEVVRLATDAQLKIGARAQERPDARN